MKIRIKENGTLWRQYAVIFGVRYQISDNNKKKKFRPVADFQPVKSASAVHSV